MASWKAAENDCQMDKRTGGFSLRWEANLPNALAEDSQTSQLLLSSSLIICGIPPIMASWKTAENDCKIYRKTRALPYDGWPSCRTRQRQTGRPSNRLTVC
jgi:ribosomal protein L36